MNLALLEIGDYVTFTPPVDIKRGEEFEGSISAVDLKSGRCYVFYVADVSRIGKWAKLHTVDGAYVIKVDVKYLGHSTYGEDAGQSTAGGKCVLDEEDVPDWAKTPATVQAEKAMETKARVFESGASRNSDEGKLQKDKFLDPNVIHHYCEFMHKNRRTDSGLLREGDNWTAGIPVDVLIASMTRHVEDVKLHHKGYVESTQENYLDSIFGSIFNLMALAHAEINLKERSKHRE